MFTKELIQCKICKILIKYKGFYSHLTGHKIKMQFYINENFDDFYKVGYRKCDNCQIVFKTTIVQLNRQFMICSLKCKSEFRINNRDYDIKVGNRTTRTEYTKKLISIKAKGRYIGRVGKKHTELSKKKISDRAKLRCSQSNYINPMKGKKRTDEDIKKLFAPRNGNPTKFEKDVQILLNNNNIVYYFQFFLTKSIKHWSFDFKLKGLPILIEADGDYWHGGPGCKTYCRDIDRNIKNDQEKTKAANERGLIVIRIWESEFKDNPMLLLDRIYQAMENKNGIN